jgi:four helix bundle protein
VGAAGLPSGMPPRGTLKVIDAAEDFAVEVTKAFRRSKGQKTFAEQTCDAAASVAANLNEGYDRGRGPDRLRYYGYARSSCEEALVWLRDAYALAEIGKRDYYRLSNRGITIVRMIRRLKY